MGRSPQVNSHAAAPEPDSTDQQQRNGDQGQPLQSRPYRSKRHRPCDVCRRRKHACIFEGEPPCRVCRELSTSCSFKDPPKKRQRKLPGVASRATTSITANQDTASSSHRRGRTRLSFNNPHSTAATPLPSPSETSPAAGVSPVNREAISLSLIDDENEDMGADQEEEDLEGEEEEQGEEEEGRDLRDPNQRDAHNSSRGNDCAGQTSLPWTDQYSTEPLPQLSSRSAGVGTQVTFDHLDVQDSVQNHFLTQDQPPLPSHHQFWQSMVDTEASHLAAADGQFLFGSTGYGNWPSIHANTMLEDPFQQALPSALANWPMAGRASDQTAPAAPSNGPREGNPPVPEADKRLNKVPDTRRPVDDVANDSLSGQIIGSSGELDPFLLDTMQYSQEDTRSFGQFQYRNILGSKSGGLQSNPMTRLPAHFIVCAPRRQAGTELMQTSKTSLEAELDTLVPIEMGARLVGLFFRYVFPGLPVVSRSQLQIRNYTLVPRTRLLRTVPAYLLAALYASAYHLRHYDPTWVLSGRDIQLPALWSIAYRGILDNMHAPRLSVLQTILVYLQRSLGEPMSPSNENAMHKNLMSVAVNIANSLGLYQDCSAWNIPMWEQRLRRRLWWVMYSEATWRSLILGSPQLIHPDQWDVRLLEADDFQLDHLCVPAEETGTQEPRLQELCRFCHLGHDFRFLAQLTPLAEDVQRSLYSVAAVKRMKSDVVAFWITAQSLLQQLQDWMSQEPVVTILSRQAAQPEARHYFHTSSASNLRLVTLTLEMLIRRSLIRLPLMLGAEETLHGAFNENQGYAKLFSGSVELVRKVTAFAQGLTAYDHCGFTYSWTRACLASCSNFVLLLLVQSPRRADADLVMFLLTRWAIVLREQSLVFDNMRLALLQLDAVLQVGLHKVFRMAPHVRASIERQLPKPSALMK